MSTRRFKKTIVLANVGSEWITTNTLKPIDLTAGQAGCFRVDPNEIIGTATATAPAPASFPRLQAHHNVGDNKFGTVRTKTIEVTKVTKYSKSNPTAAVAQVTHLGYNEASTATDLTLPVIESGREYAEVYIYFQFYGKDLKLVYGDLGYRKTLTIRITAADTRDTFAQKIIDQINTSGTPAGDIVVSNELSGLVVASKVTTGTLGMSDYRVGVKLTAVAVPEDDLFNTVQPIVNVERELITFTVSANKLKYTITPLTITETTAANAGSGWASQVAAEEAESQGYDRHREFFDNNLYEQKNPFYLRAVKGTKYDGLYIEFDWTHDTPGGHPQRITEPYTLQIFFPTGTGQAVADYFNAWLTGRFTAITM